MKITGRPRLSAKAIEQKAATLLELYKRDFFERVQPTPIRSIATFLNRKFHIAFDYTRTLGFSENGQRIVGAFNPRKRLILIDASLEADPQKFNFTLAHELGHLAIHRNVKIEYKDDDRGIKPDETIMEDEYEEGSWQSESDWMEWQANTYAASLLMPEVIVIAALIETQKAMGVRRIGSIFVDDQSCNLVDMIAIIGNLSDFFSVSKTAIQYRLKKLNLIEDHRSLRSLRDIL